jgi:hypothetical protein
VAAARRSLLSGVLTGVAANSARHAWAAGESFLGNGVVFDRWNVITWKQVPGPSPMRGSVNGDAVFSATNAWAVSILPTRIKHWNGKGWTYVHGARLTGSSSLQDVHGSSASNIWAVGNNGNEFLIEHWNGTSWKHVPCPRP